MLKETETPLISFIIPTLNEESVLESTLKNIRECTLFPSEVIVSDGKSTDKTEEIARRLADVYLRDGGNNRQTIAAGRNAGAKTAKGEYIVFLDADVTIPSPNDFLRRALDYFAKDSKLVALSTSLRVSPEHESTMDRLVFGFVTYANAFQNNIMKVGAGFGEFQMLKRSAFEAVGGFNEALVAVEDYDLFRRLVKIGHTRTERSLLVYHTGRRAHKIGWPKLLSIWLSNGIGVTFFKKSTSKEWTPIR